MQGAPCRGRGRNRLRVCVFVPEEGWEGQEGVQVSVISAPFPSQPRPGLRAANTYLFFPWTTIIPFGTPFL